MIKIIITKLIPSVGEIAVIAPVFILILHILATRKTMAFFELSTTVKRILDAGFVQIIKPEGVTWGAVGFYHKGREYHVKLNSRHSCDYR